MQPSLTQHNGSVQPAPWLAALRAPAIRYTVEEMLLPREYIALRSTCTALHDVMTVVFGLTSAAPEPDQPPPLENSVYLERDRLVVGAAPHPKKVPPLWWLVLDANAYFVWATMPDRQLSALRPQVPPLAFSNPADGPIRRWLLDMTIPWEADQRAPFDAAITTTHIPKDAVALGPVCISYLHRWCNLPLQLKRLSICCKLSKQIRAHVCQQFTHRQRCNVEQIFRNVRNRLIPGGMFVPASVTHLEISTERGELNDRLVFPAWPASSALRTLVLHNRSTCWNHLSNLPACLEDLIVDGALGPGVTLPAKLQRLTVYRYDGDNDAPAAWPPDLIFFRAREAEALPTIPTLRTLIIDEWSGPTLAAAHFPPALETLDIHAPNQTSRMICTPRDLPATLRVLRLSTGGPSHYTLDWSAPVVLPPLLVVCSVDIHFTAWDRIPASVRVLCFAAGEPPQSFWDSGLVDQLSGALVLIASSFMLIQRHEMSWRTEPHPWWGHLTENLNQPLSYRFQRQYLPPRPTPHMWWGNLLEMRTRHIIRPRTSQRGPHDNEPLEL